MYKIQKWYNVQRAQDKWQHCKMLCVFDLKRVFICMKHLAELAKKGAGRMGSSKVDSVDNIVIAHHAKPYGEKAHRKKHAIGENNAENHVMITTAVEENIISIPILQKHSVGENIFLHIKY